MKKIYTLFTVIILLATVTANAQNYVLFGNAQNGGSAGHGTLFQYNMKYGITTAPVNFNDSIGTNPNYGALILDTATGRLFGMTYGGGRYSYGAIFSYGSCDGYQTMVNMQTNAPEGEYPYGSLTYYKPTGLFYGVTDDGGTYDLGTLFSFNPVNSKVVILYNFTEPIGAYPDGSLTYDPNTHLLYGLAANGGANNYGSIFSFDPSTGAVTNLFSFDYTDGGNEYNSLMYNAVNKLLYGFSYNGGTGGVGVLFSFDPATNKDSTVINFNGTNGSYPEGNMLFNPLDSLLYGMTYQGGTNSDGVIFSYNPKNGQDSTRVNLDATHGTYPSGSFTYNPNDSLLYAVASQGGSSSSGTLFSFNPRNNKDSVLFNFGSTGSYPYADMILDTAKDELRGMSYENGTDGYGSAYVYKIKSATDSILFNFNDTNGAYPYGAFTTLNGILYGMTVDNLVLGSNGPGLIFSYNPATGTDSVMHRFIYTAKEEYAENTHLTYYHANGMYYGTTYEGGIYNVGTLFRFNPVTKKDSVLFSFNDTIGEYPYSGLTYCPSNGLLYGSTENGGVNGNGAVFNFNPATGKTNLVASLSGSTGDNAYSDLTYCPANGLLYGTTESGGAHGVGVIYSIDPATNTYTDVLDFSGTADGSYPESALTYNPGNGLFYGMTDQGGSTGDGALFMFNPVTNKDSLLYSFYSTTGSYPASTVTIDPSDTILYGVTASGGTNSDGVLFSFNIKSGKDTVLFNFVGTTGQSPICDLLLVNVKEALTVTKDTSICKGSNITLSATAGPGSEYAWDNGATTSSITVSPMADSTYKVHVCRGIYGKDTTVTVNVTPSPTVTVMGHDTIMNGSTDTLSGMVTGATSYVWSTSATTDSIVVSPTSNTTYTLTGKGANGCTTATTFTVVVNTVTGIATVNSASAKAYPNPTAETIYLSFTMKGSAYATIQIVDVVGNVVSTINTTINNGQVIPFNVSNLAPGVYFAHITSARQSQVVRFVKE